MFLRFLQLSNTQSCFIFGARGTGKSTYLKHKFKENAHVINLLEDIPFKRYGRNPDQLIEDLQKFDPKTTTIIIDEIQKLPKILDTIHLLIEEKKYRFILTGSSARKLKRGSANLLAGRAFQYYMHPLTLEELGDDFELSSVLEFGSLPRCFSLDGEDKKEYLRSYTETYLKEEVLEEQLVRNTFAFRNFLEIAAQENGNSLNFSRIGKDLDIDYKTAQTFFQILEDTLIGFFLPAYHKSTRKSLKHQPKFYLFDTGVKRAMERSLHQPLNPGTFAYGKAFEHFMICEIFRTNSYRKLDYKLSHYQTTAGGEVDLVLSRGKEVIAVEIKSSHNIEKNKVLRFASIAEAMNPMKRYYVSQDKVHATVKNVDCLDWRSFLDVLSARG